MTPKQKRIAIAEACGWKFNASCDLAGKAFPECWTHDDYPIVYHDYELPDYLNDLNAMHDAEEMLTTPEQRYNFISILYDIVNNFIPDEVDDYVPDYWEVSSVQVFPHLHATAAQRAEAFGLTLKLW